MRAVAASLLATSLVSLTADASAESAEAIMRMPEDRVMAAAKNMARTVTRAAPVEVDSATTLLGASFVAKTRTFTYRYESTLTKIEVVTSQRSYVENACGDSTRRALLARGITFKHVYLTPIGERSFSVRESDC